MVSLTRLMLDAHCPACGRTDTQCIDLLEIDNWLHD